MHNKNLQILAPEMLKFCNNIAPPIFTETFSKRNLNYKLDHKPHFSVPHVRSIYIMELKVYRL